MNRETTQIAVVPAEAGTQPVKHPSAAGQKRKIP
jgi:hypothetical protein